MKAAKSLAAVALLVPILAGASCPGPPPLAWACVGESWAALSCPWLEHEATVPVYDLAMPGHTVGALIRRLPETRMALQGIPEPVVLVWLSAGTLGPDGLGQDPDATAWALRGYVEELRAARPGVVVFLALHNSGWTDAGVRLMPPLPMTAVLDFECLDGVVAYADALHLRPEDYRRRVRLALNVEECP